MTLFSRKKRSPDSIITMNSVAVTTAVLPPSIYNFGPTLPLSLTNPIDSALNHLDSRGINVRDYFLTAAVKQPMFHSDTNHSNFANGSATEQC